MSGATNRAAGLGIPQALDVEHFAQARVQELEFLDIAVAAVTAHENGGDAGSRAGLDVQSQALPRHMRRRAASHKPRRMPVALKNRGRGGGRGGRGQGRDIGPASSRGVSTASAAANNNAAQSEQRCRKHRRRPRSMLEARSPHVTELEDDAPARWLETHIWHAKRMHMREAWGFMLPTRSNRGPRAATEAVLKHCTLQDVTFLRPLEIRGPISCLLGVLSTITDPLDCRHKDWVCVQGFVEAPTHVHRVNEFPLGCIAPATVMWSPALDNEMSHGYDEGDHRLKEGGLEEDEDLQRVWLWVHPAGAKEALREIRKACLLEGAPWVGMVEAGPLVGGLCRLRVRGRRAHEIVQQVVRTTAGNTSITPTSGNTSTPAAADNNDKRSPRSVKHNPDEGNGQAVTDKIRTEVEGSCNNRDTRGGRIGVAAGQEDGDLALSERAAVSHGSRNAAVGFERAAQDNARRWRLLATSSAPAVGGGGKFSLNALADGSILALTALDPRELSRGGDSAVTDLIGGGGGGGGGGSGSHGGVQNKTLDTPKNSIAGGGDEEPGGGGGDGADGRRGSASSDVQPSPPTLPTPWPFAAVSPLWDADARGLSAKLAGARPDHALNERRRREKSRATWDSADLSSVPVAVNSADGKGSGGGGGMRSAVQGRRRFPIGETPVFLIRSSGTRTGAHRAAGSAELQSDFSGGGGGGDGGRKEVEKKRRLVGEGWDIVVSAGWASVFFHALVMAGARAISLADADALAVETRLSRFPADFPDTTAGREYWDEIGAESLSKWQRTRPKHRGFKLPPLGLLPTPQAAPVEPPRRPTPLMKKDRDEEGRAPVPQAVDTPEVLPEKVTSKTISATAAATAAVPKALQNEFLSLFRPDFSALALGGGQGVVHREDDCALEDQGVRSLLGESGRVEDVTMGAPIGHDDGGGGGCGGDASVSVSGNGNGNGKNDGDGVNDSGGGVDNVNDNCNEDECGDDSGINLAETAAMGTAVAITEEHRVLPDGADRRSETGGGGVDGSPRGEPLDHDNAAARRGDSDGELDIDRRGLARDLMQDGGGDDQVGAVGVVAVGDREPFAVARGFHYFQAFLPTEETGPMAGGGDSFCLPPLRLAMPTMVNVKLTLLKGVPHAGALIYAASPRHISAWEAGQQGDYNNSHIHHISKPWPGIQVAADGRGSPESAPLSPPVPPAIGAVTSGGFSFLCGIGVGRGVCEAVAVRDALAVSPARRGIGDFMGSKGRDSRGCRKQSKSSATGKKHDRRWALVLVGSRSGGGGNTVAWLRPCVMSVTE